MVNHVILSRIMDYIESILLPQQGCQIFPHPHNGGGRILRGIRKPFLGMGVVNQDLGLVRRGGQAHILGQQLRCIQLAPVNGCGLIHNIKILDQIVKIIQLFPGNMYHRLCCRQGSAGPGLGRFRPLLGLLSLLRLPFRRLLSLLGLSGLGLLPLLGLSGLGLLFL